MIIPGLSDQAHPRPSPISLLGPTRSCLTHLPRRVRPDRLQSKEDNERSNYVEKYINTSKD